ncbi:MAG: long-chain fatty acid--CoA ligase, partial [Alphaproteobacteria bacterium]|nr:long-chain fatty acid--CoA ligase [Alphaproteobacteria bacterium]
LRACTCGGQALPEDVHRGFEARFGAEIAEGYGLTEASPNITTNLYGAKKIRSVGPPVWGVEVRIVDDDGKPVPRGERGEVIARGPGIMKGYFRNPEATAATIRDGWLFTGDIGRVDEDGYVYIVDRKKELIIAGGYNIYPREVEDVLYAHPDVLEAVVVGRPDEKLGEMPVAHVAPKTGRRLDPEALRSYCAERVSRYKVPRDFVILPELPKGPTGKIDRRRIKASP